MKNAPQKTIVETAEDGKIILQQVDYLNFTRIPDLSDFLGTEQGQEMFMGIS